MIRKVFIGLLVAIQVLAIAWAVVPASAEDVLLVPTQKPRPTQRPRPTRKPRGTPTTVPTETATLVPTATYTLVPTNTPEPPCEVYLPSGYRTPRDEYTTWQANCTYVAYDSISVLGPLTIPEGVTIRFLEHPGEVRVSSALWVEGTAEKPVVIYGWEGRGALIYTCFSGGGWLKYLILEGMHIESWQGTMVGPIIGGYFPYWVTIHGGC